MQDLVEQGRRLLQEMEPAIARCIARRDTAAPVFHGCYDWHSAVHGHWALFRIARALGRTSPETEQAEQSLDPARLKVEGSYLAREPRFENPYGRAWLLRLAVEFQVWATGAGIPDRERLRGMADGAAESILRHRPPPTSALSREYDNASWAVYQLHGYYTFSGNAERLDEVNRLVVKHFVESSDRVGFASDRGDFFSLYGNWAYLIARTQPAETLARFLSEHPPGEVPGPGPPVSDHALGLPWSRAWALGALARLGPDPAVRQRMREAWEGHIRQGFANHEAFKDNYGAYGHWVPQFAVYALTEEME
jgi:hypothetical protein